MTVVFLYVASYKTGHLFFDDGSGGINSIKMLIHSLESDMDFSLKVQDFLKFARTQLNTFLIMNFGGCSWGSHPGWSLMRQHSGWSRY